MALVLHVSTHCVDNDIVSLWQMHIRAVVLSSYRGRPVQTCRRTPIPWCTWWCQPGRCSARSRAAETTWGKPHTAGRTHTTSSGSGGDAQTHKVKYTWTHDSICANTAHEESNVCYPVALWAERHTASDNSSLHQEACYDHWTCTNPHTVIICGGY